MADRKCVAGGDDPDKEEIEREFPKPVITGEKKSFEKDTLGLGIMPRAKVSPPAKAQRQLI